MEEALDATVLRPIQKYIRRRQATTEEYIEARPIYEMCNEAERLQATIRLMWWRDQDNFFWKGPMDSAEKRRVR